MTIQIINNNGLAGKNLLNIPQKNNLYIPQSQMIKSADAPNLFLFSKNLTALKTQVLSFQGQENKSPKEVSWLRTATLMSNFLDKFCGDEDGKGTTDLNPNSKVHVDNIEIISGVLGGQTLKVEGYGDITNGLSIENLNKTELDDKGNPKTKNIVILKDTLKTMIEATNYKPVKIEKGTQDKKTGKNWNYNLFVNNKELSKDLKPVYSAEAFNALFNKLKEHDVFALNVHPELGLVKTAGTTKKENFEMGARYWITDTCHNINLMKEQEDKQKQVPLAVKTIARFYKENENPIQYIIQNPVILDFVKDGSPKAMKLGVPHILIPKEIETAEGKKEIELELDGDFNRWRQESHGQALKTIVTGIKDGLVNKKPYGLAPKDVNENVIGTIVGLTSYFKAINYPNAPSNGNWEEKPSPEGSIHDTAVIVDALKSTKDLMFNHEYDNNSEIVKVRQQIQKTDKQFVKFNKKKLFTNEKELDNLIQAGEKQIKEHYHEEFPHIDGRNVDASQSFMVRLAKYDNEGELNPLQNAEKSIKILTTIEKELVGDFGIRRYNGDSYLGKNYNIAADKDGNINLGYFHKRDEFGAKDCSTNALIDARNKICGGKEKEDEAQWFFDPVMSTAYNKIRKDLVSYKEDLKKKELSLPENLDSKIKFCFDKQTEYLNRGLARVTGDKGKDKDGKPKHYLKANGVDCPTWGVPEAYMKVSTLSALNPDVTNKQDLAYSAKKEQFVPGVNTSLAWAQSELFKACKEYQETLKETN